MEKIIGLLWEKLYKGGFNAMIKNKINEYAIGLYPDSWGEILQTDLDRSFTGDLEEYRNADPENLDIDIYIALK